MPMAAPSPCCHPSCAALVQRTDRYCDIHRKQSQREQTRSRRADPVKKAALDFYASRPWRAARVAQLARDPLCAHCNAAGRVTAATVVDHVVEIKSGGERFDADNLQSLCHRCHSVKTSRDGGRW